MDYTQFPRGNLEPGQYNYDLLQELYGTVGGSTSSGGLRRLANLNAAALEEDGVIPDKVIEKYNIAAQTAAATVGHTDYVDLGDGFTIKFRKSFW
jgi:hypothetical protein